jgi:hypothetical protein
MLAAGFPVIALSILLNTEFGSKPESMSTPDSMASGRSIEFRIVMAGNPKMADSSLTDPLSEMTTFALF